MVTSENEGGGPTSRLFPPTAATQFGVVWDALTELMGGAATATLLRRARNRALARDGRVAGLAILRDRFEYRYVLPDEWARESPDAVATLCVLLRELDPLLRELTGPVVIRRLRAMPELVACAHVFGSGEP